MKLHQTSTKPERTGHTANCTCGWIAWQAARHNAQRLADDHARQHKPRPAKES